MWCGLIKGWAAPLINSIPDTLLPVPYLLVWPGAVRVVSGVNQLTSGWLGGAAVLMHGANKEMAI